MTPLARIFIKIRFSPQPVIYRINVPFSVIEKVGAQVMTDDFDLTITRTKGDTNTILTTNAMLVTEGVRVFLNNSLVAYDINESVDASYMINGLRITLKKVIYDVDEEGETYISDYRLIDEVFIPTVNAVPDWLDEWNTNKTQIGTEMVVSPKFFAGTKNSDGSLTGVAFGRDCIGTGANKRSGIFGLKNDKCMFQLDPLNDIYEFCGSVVSTHPNGMPEAILNYKSGNIRYPGVSLWYDNGQVMERRNFVYENGSLAGAETIYYDRYGNELGRTNRFGVLQGTTLQEYWVNFNAYYWESRAAYSSGTALYSAMQSAGAPQVVAIKQNVALTATGAVSRFVSDGGSNASKNNYICKGTKTGTTSPTSIKNDEWLTGYMCTGLGLPMMTIDGYYKRFFQRYVNGQPTGSEIAVTLDI